MNWIIIGSVNSLAPGRFGCNFKNSIFKLALLIGIFKSSYNNILKWMPQDLTDDKSTLVQVMAWCRQATSHYLSQCWPRSLSPYGVTRPQWVNGVSPIQHRATTWCNAACFFLLFFTQWNFVQNANIIFLKHSFEILFAKHPPFYSGLNVIIMRLCRIIFYFLCESFTLKCAGKMIALHVHDFYVKG